MCIMLFYVILRLMALTVDFVTLKTDSSWTSLQPRWEEKSYLLWGSASVCCSAFTSRVMRLPILLVSAMNMQAKTLVSHKLCGPEDHRPWCLPGPAGHLNSMLSSNYSNIRSINENPLEMLKSDFNSEILWCGYIKPGKHCYDSLLSSKPLHGSVTDCRNSMCKTMTRPTPDRGRAKNLVQSLQRSDTEDNQELILLALVPSCSCVPMLVVNIHGDTVG